MSYVALYRRWRPETFADLVGQEHISRPLARAVTSGQTSHAYLFTGPRGTGKTSTAKIMARALNCAEGPTLTPCGVCASCRSISDGSSMDVFEIDAASNRGIDEIRDLRESVKFAPAEGRYKIYIIDEVHMLTTEAFNALLKTLEEPPARVLFILATTEPHKVPATIQSRCQRYDFHRITAAEIRSRLVRVCQESGIAADEEALGIIALQADGGMRDALSILDQCSALAEGTLTPQRVQETLGLAGRTRMTQMAAQIADRDAAGLITSLGALLQDGCELRQILAELALHFRALMIAGVGGTLGETELYAEERETLAQAALRFTQEEIMAVLRALNETMQELRTAPQPRIAAETMLLSLCRTVPAAMSFAPSAPNAADAARIARLEEEVQRLTARLAAGGTAPPAAPAVPTSAPQERPAPTFPPPRTRSAVQKAAYRAAPPVEEGAARQLDMALWQRFQTRLKERHRLAASLLSGAAYEGLTETHFFIRPSSDMARDYIAKRHRTVFEEVMTELVGHPVAVVCTGGAEEAAAPPLPVQPPTYPAQVAELLKIAGDGARVEEVAPAQRRAPQTAAPPAAEDVPCEVYEPTPDEEAEMFAADELPDDT